MTYDLNTLSKKTLPSVYIETYGCQMNDYDTEIVKQVLQEGGFPLVEDRANAGIILLNTCSVREHAADKVRNRVHVLHHERKGEPLLVGILGCMATNFESDLNKHKGLKIDFVVGPDSYRRLAQIILSGLEKKKLVVDVALSEYETYEALFPMRKEGINAWVAVMRGCNNFCTFCIVPYTRGRERSRSLDEVLLEVEDIARQGFPQITLLGQNVNSYHDGDKGFSDLLEELSKVEGIERIRFTSPHPKDFPESLLKVIAENKKVCKHIHLPLQAGNNRVLKAMNRCYTKEEYLKLVDLIREYCPDISITTDIIVGFPTETSEEFLDTVDVMNRVKYDSAFIFKYSPREGTLASRKYEDDVSPEEKTRRIVLLNDLQREHSLEANQKMIGKDYEVLLEKRGSKKNDQEWQARTDTNKLVILPEGDYSIGQKPMVRIQEASPNALRGTYL